MNHENYPTVNSSVNRYCTNCLRTRRFLDQPTHVVCETCRKRLEKVTPELSVKR
ncbi:MAG: hypothetical protein ACYTDX_01655 [Planctomycetota bacterium]|jgi:hypothetical protein